MPSVNEAIENLSSRYPGDTWTHWVNVVGSLIFADMRIDPTNMNWKSGDRLYTSNSVSPIVKDALLLAGADQQSVSQPALPLLEMMANLQHPQRLFFLLDEADTHQLPAPATLSSNIIVVSPAHPSQEDQWEIHRIIEHGSATISDFLNDGIKDATKPVWVLIPGGQARHSVTVTSNGSAPSSLPPLADRMKHLGTETAFDVLAEVHALRDEGRDIISFGIGEPDFDSPTHVKEAAKLALDENQTHYGPSAGLPELRSAIARYIERTRHIHADPDEVVVTPGAKPIIFDTIMSLIDPGDEVLYPNPGYPIYESVLDWVGAKTVPLPLWENNNWNFNLKDLEERITSKTKMIVINTPGNPTGTMIERDALEEIARIAHEHNLWVISDEVYSQIVFGAEFHSPASLPGMKERTIIVDGFSKTYAMTGWRLGYGIMNRDLAKQVAKIETNIDSCTCSFSQIAATHALDGPQHESEHMIEQFHQRGMAITELLNNIDGIRCLPPQGAFYVFPNVTGACQRMGFAGAEEFQHALLHEAGVAVLPRTCFGRRNEGEDQEYIRFSYATSMENIQKGLRRIKEFVEGK